MVTDSGQSGRIQLFLDRIVIVKDIQDAVMIPARLAVIFGLVGTVFPAAMDTPNTGNIGHPYLSLNNGKHGLFDQPAGLAAYGAFTFCDISLPT